MYTSHENERKTGVPFSCGGGGVVYCRWIRQRLHLLSTSVGIGREADKLIRRMADRMSMKREETYSNVVSFLRRRPRFDLLKICRS